MTADPLAAELPDGGPLYGETDLTRAVAEPWNAATAALFLVLALVWLVRLRGRYRRHPFLVGGVLLLWVGGLGGTLYHAFRAVPLFLVMDYGPIMALGVSAALYLWAYLHARFRVGWRVPVLTLGLFAGAVAAASPLKVQVRITAEYLALAGLMLLPLALVLVRRGGRDAGWVGLAGVSFAAALACRWADTWRPPALPMGTHWLWHLFGVAATAALLEYFYRVEADWYGGHRQGRGGYEGTGPSG
jgi:hemolysin III